ncbi:hypothetical protein Tco_0419363 [Tanacetum coccineum]
MNEEWDASNPEFHALFILEDGASVAKVWGVKGVILGVVYHDPWREDLDGDRERGFDCLTFALVSSKAHREGCRPSRGGLPYWRRSYSGFKEEAFELERRVILPKKSQTILDSHLGYVGMYTHHFSLSNLRLPIPPFISYGGEPTIDLLRSFLNLGSDGDWLTLSNRGSVDVPKALLKPITHLGNWKDSFFFIENKIIPSDYPVLLLSENKLDKKSFKDKVPLHPEMDPLYD